MKKQKKLKGAISKKGYMEGSPDQFNDFNLIPSNQITMKNVNQNLKLIPMQFPHGNMGEPIIAKPGQEYNFPGYNAVLELPHRQMGGNAYPFVMTTPQFYGGDEQSNGFSTEQDCPFCDHMQAGGTIVNSSSDSRYKAYQDSLNLYNSSQKEYERLKSIYGKEPYLVLNEMNLPPSKVPGAIQPIGRKKMVNIERHIGAVTYDINGNKVDVPEKYVYTPQKNAPKDFFFQDGDWDEEAVDLKTLIQDGIDPRDMRNLYVDMYKKPVNKISAKSTPNTSTTPTPTPTPIATPTPTAQPTPYYGINITNGMPSPIIPKLERVPVFDPGLAGLPKPIPAPTTTYTPPQYQASQAGRLLFNNDGTPVMRKGRPPLPAYLQGPDITLAQKQAYWNTHDAAGNPISTPATPTFQMGGTHTPIPVANRHDPRFVAYNDSLAMYNNARLNNDLIDMYRPGPDGKAKMIAGKDFAQANYDLFTTPTHKAALAAVKRNPAMNNPGPNLGAIPMGNVPNGYDTAYRMTVSKPVQPYVYTTPTPKPKPAPTAQTTPTTQPVVQQTSAQQPVVQQQTRYTPPTYQAGQAGKGLYDKDGKPIMRQGRPPLPGYLQGPGTTLAQKQQYWSTHDAQGNPISTPTTPSFKKGGNFIGEATDKMKKKGTKGAFTDYCGGNVTEDCIERGLKSKDTKTRKRAAFAKAMHSIAKKKLGGDVPTQYEGLGYIDKKNATFFNTLAQNNINHMVSQQMEDMYTLHQQMLKIPKAQMGIQVGPQVDLPEDNNWQWGMEQTQIENPYPNQNVMMDPNQTAGAPATSSVYNQAPAQQRPRFGFASQEAKANALLSGTGWLANMLENAQKNKTSRDLRMNTSSDDLFLPVTGSRGDYEMNSGAFRPDQMVPVQFGGYQNMGYGHPSYQEGGEYSLGDDEIQAILAAGGEIEYVD